MNISEIFKTITDVINGKRHPNYSKTVENAKKLKAFSLGNKSVFEYCKQFDLRETAENFQYKKDLVKPDTPEMINKIISVRKKIQNANHQRVIMSEKQTDIGMVLSRFSMGRNPVEWIGEEIDRLETTDPNAYLIIESETTDGTSYASPYPFIAGSAAVLDFKHSKRGELQYLIVACESNFEKHIRYTGYFRGFTVVFEPVEKITTSYKPELQVIGITKEAVIETTYSVVFGDFRYDATIYKTGAKSVLAMPIGYLKSDFGYHSIIDTVDATFSNFVRQNVDYKFAVMKAGNPTLLQYRFVNGDDDESEADENIGFSEKRPEKKPLPGLSESEKKLDGITINLSRNFINRFTPENLPSLDTYFKHAGAPVENLEFLRSEHDRSELAVLRGIFGTDYNSNPEKVKTATEVFSNDSSVHAALIPFDTHCLKMWKFIVESVAQLMGATDCQVSYVQDIDYRLTPISELLKLLESLKNTDAPQSLRIEICKKIIERLFMSEPLKVAMMKKRIQFDPFAGLSFDEIQRRIDSPLVSDFDKKLHLNLESVFDSIRLEQKDYLSFTDEKLTEIVKQKVDLVDNGKKI